MDIDDYLPQLFSQITIHPFDTITGIALVIGLLLLIASAFLSGSEVAFFSLSPSQMDEIRSRRHPSDERLERLLVDSERLLGTILIGNNFINVAIVILLGYVLTNLFDFSLVPTLGFLVQVVLLTFLLLLFGEILPKVYGQSNALRFSRAATPTMVFLSRLLSPLSRLLVWIGSRVTRLVGRKTFDLSADDLSKAIELTTDAEDEQGMLNEIVKFYGKTASEVMTPRIDIAALEWDATYDAVLTFVVEKGYSRIPIYDERIDNVKGILYAKDLLPHIDEKSDFNWHDLVRSVFFVPETKKVDNLLEDFRAQKIHMAIVVDEFGGTSGLVTMEDLLEEIVGEISDEYDEEDKLYTIEADGSYLFDAKTSIVDFFRIVKIDASPEIREIMDEVDTLGGLILEIKGDFPLVGEVIHLDDHRFEIVKMGRRKISQVRFVPSEKEGGE